MKVLLVWITTVVTVLILGAVGQRAEFGQGDISGLLRDRGLVQRQIMCVLGQGSCDQIGNMLKQAIPEFVTRNCRSCTPQQAANGRKLANFIQSNYPDAWRQVITRYRG